MRMKGSLAISCLILCSISFAVSQTQVQFINMKAVKCNVSSKFLQNATCFAKSYSRTMSTINVNVIAKKPLSDIHLKLTLFFKYGVIYREAMHSPVFDMCEALRSESSNRMVSQLLQLIRDTFDPSQVHECPYSSLLISNATIKTHSLIPIYPTGDYKAFFNFTKKNGEFIGLITVVTSVMTPNKDTFG